MPHPKKAPADLFRSELLTMSAYHVADPTGYIKLDAMENPYRWPSAMIDEWLTLLRTCEPNRYPDPSSSALKTILRSSNQVPECADLLLGNGSDELIQIILMAIAGRDESILVPSPTFVMYQQIARVMGIRVLSVPLMPETFELDQTAMAEAIDQHRPAVIFLAYPNNPTGNLFDRQTILDILKQSPGLVILDEAYAPFADATMMDQLAHYDNLLVMRTVSKLGLAGLRLGLLAGAKKWIDPLERLRLPYNINVLTQLSVEFALNHYPVFAEQAERICDDRSELLNALNQIDGIIAYPSRANFILFKPEKGSADAIFEGLKKRGVLIRNLTAAGGALDNCLRVTVGTEDENCAFVKALCEIIQHDFASI